MSEPTKSTGPIMNNKEFLKSSPKHIPSLFKKEISVPNGGTHMSKLSIETQVPITPSSHIPSVNSFTSPNDLMDYIFQADSVFNANANFVTTTPHLFSSSNTNKLN